MRYQLGKAINGTGSLWSTSTYPLTAGPLSDADPYHTHPTLLNSSYDYFKLYNQNNQIIPLLNSYDTVNIGNYLNQVYQVKWEAVTTNGFAHIESIGSSGSIAVVADQSGTFEIEYQLFIHSSASTTDDSIDTSAVAMYSSGGTPTWFIAGLGDLISKSVGGSLEGIDTSIRNKFLVDLDALDSNYNKLIVLSNHVSSGTPDNPIIISNIGNFEYLPGTGAIGGYGSWLKATLIKKA
jgi:hypothetical protein